MAHKSEHKVFLTNVMAQYSRYSKSVVHAHDASFLKGIIAKKNSDDVAILSDVEIERLQRIEEQLNYFDRHQEHGYTFQGSVMDNITLKKRLQQLSQYPLVLQHPQRAIISDAVNVLHRAKPLNTKTLIDLEIFIKEIEDQRLSRMKDDRIVYFLQPRENGLLPYAKRMANFALMRGLTMREVNQQDLWAIQDNYGNAPNVSLQALKQEFLITWRSDRTKGNPQAYLSAADRLERYVNAINPRTEYVVEGLFRAVRKQ